MGGGGEKGEALYEKPAARFENAETQSQTRSGTIHGREVDPSTPWPAPLPNRAHDRARVACIQTNPTQLRPTDSKHRSCYNPDALSA